MSDGNSSPVKPRQFQQPNLRVSCSLSIKGLGEYLVRQLNFFFPDERPVTLDDILPVLPRALERLEHSFSEVNNKYFFDGNNVVFSHLHGDQYAVWLYFVSNELFSQNGDSNICSKIFMLNKALHGCDIFFEVALPSVFLLVHPLGSVMGRGDYNDYFVCYQSCGIGSNKEVYPKMGRHLTLRPGSSVLGNSVIGNMCQLGAGTLAIDVELKDGLTLLGRPGSYKFKENAAPYPLWRRFKQEA